MRLVLYPYRMDSTSARDLARTLGCLRVYPDRRYRPRITDAVINWGNSLVPRWITDNTLIWNSPDRVAIACNKLATFRALSGTGVNIPEWTTNRNIAEEWIRAGSRVFCRTRLTAHSGHGITVVDTVDSLIPAPLYSRYLKKKKEYRAHVWGDTIIDVQEKRRQNGAETNFIRSHRFGYVFCRSGIVEPEDMRTQAILAVKTLGLDFGAVDIILPTESGLSTVLEVNTAPGIEGRTILSYALAIKRSFPNVRFSV